MNILKKLYYFGFHRAFLLLLLVFITDFAFAQIISINTKGYALGQLSKLSIERTGNSAMNGEILLGHESSSNLNLGQIPQQSNIVITNPWRFCFDRDRYDELKDYVGYYVVVEYKTPKNNALLSCSATNEFITIYPLLKDVSLEKMQIQSDIVAVNGSGTSSGVEFGRVASTIENGQNRKQNFLILQVGNSGNEFRLFRTPDLDLYYFAAESLKMALKVRVHYIEQIPNVTNESSTRLLAWKIEILDQESSDPYQNL